MFQKREVAVKKYQKRLTSTADNQIVKSVLYDYHPNIVRYFWVEYTQDFCYLALQLCQANFKQFVEQKYENPKVETIGILKDILS